MSVPRLHEFFKKNIVSLSKCENQTLHSEYPTVVIDLLLSKQSFAVQC